MSSFLNRWSLTESKVRNTELDAQLTRAVARDIDAQQQKKVDADKLTELNDKLTEVDARNNCRATELTNANDNLRGQVRQLQMEKDAIQSGALR